MVRRFISIVICYAAVVSCIDEQGGNKNIGDRVQARFEQSAEMNENLYAGSVETLDTYLFYVAADPHINQTHQNLSIFNDAMRGDERAEFGVILGDCIDVKDNYDRYLDALAYSHEKHLYDYPVFHILGNHDTYYNGWVDYKEHIGPSVYWFEAVFSDGKDLYITLDTATGTLGRKQTEWFKEFLSENRSKYRHCTILTHTNLFYTDNSQLGSGNLPIEETISLIDFFGEQNVSLVLQGHDHYREEIIHEKVRYAVLGTIRDEAMDPEYLIVKSDADGLSLEWKLISE